MASGTIKKPIKEFNIIRSAATNNSFSLNSSGVNSIGVSCESTDEVLACGIEAFPSTSWPLVTSTSNWDRQPTRITINFSSSSTQSARVTGWAILKRKT